MIEFRYLAHSSFLLTCGDTKIILDPWLKGPAYYKQWFLWPLPVDAPEELEADAVVISHGHEDHLHAETLRAMNKNATVFFPMQWRAGIKPFLNLMGYNKVVEAISFRTHTINDVKITYIGFSLESVTIIEYKNEVVVNINDALNSNHENAVDFILKELRARWPKIDYLLSGWSGASYFPNQVRYPGKNDEEIGKLREQYFANNFCRFTEILQPKFAVPFASGFVLLTKVNQWINHVKFPRNKVTEYFNTHFKNTANTVFLNPFPGDNFSAGKLSANSPLHNLEEEAQYALAYKHYAKEIEDVNTTMYCIESDVDRLVTELNHWCNFNKRLYHHKVIEDIHFSIRLDDAETDTYLNVTYENKQLVVKKAKEALPDRKILITTSAMRMLYGLKKVWGGDVLTIGYGLVVEVYDELSLEKNLDIVCIRLITRYPIARQDLFKYPLRALRFYTYNPKLTSLWLKQKISLKPYVNKYPYNERDHWLTYKKCDLCAVCKMPEVDLSAYAK